MTCGTVYFLTSLPSTLGAFVGIADQLSIEKNPAVRLAAFLALADVEDHTFQSRLVEELRRPENLEDRWIRDALTSAVARVDWLFLAEVAEGKQPLPEQALGVLSTVADHYARRDPSKYLNSIVTALAEGGWQLGLLADDFTPVLMDLGQLRSIKPDSHSHYDILYSLIKPPQ